LRARLGTNYDALLFYNIAIPAQTPKFADFRPETGKPGGVCDLDYTIPVGKGWEVIRALLSTLRGSVRRDPKESASFPSRRKMKALPFGSRRN